MLQITTKLFGFNDKTKKWVTRGQVEVCITGILTAFPWLGNWSFVLCYSSWWHCYILAVPRKVTDSLLVLRKETCRIEWLTITVFLFFFFPDKKIGLCVWLDKTFNWEETLLIAFSEVKCPLNMTIYWLNHIISRVINLNHLVLMKFTDFSFIHFSLSVSISFMHMYIHKNCIFQCINKIRAL